MLPDLPTGAPPCTEHDWSATPRAIQLLVRFLLVQLAGTRESNATNSTNSSFPPASDRPGKVRRLPRRSTGRRRGAQPGHPGHHRPLVDASKVNRIRDLKPPFCQYCGAALHGNDPNPERFQYFDVPPIKPDITEFRRHALQCQNCDRVTLGELPWDVQCSPFSPRVEAHVASLTGEFKLSRRAAQAAMRTWLGIDLSLGAISACERRVAQTLAAPVQEAHEYVQAQPVGHADETTYREGKRQTWLWTLATALVVVYVVQRRRTTAAAKRLLGSFHGILVCDRLGSYNFYGGLMQYCWAHLARLWEKWILRGGESEDLGRRLRRLTKRMFRRWKPVKEGQLSREVFAKKMGKLRHQVEECLEEAARCTHPKTARTARKLLKHVERLWTFVEHEGVEPTNNTAERAERAGVLWRKRSYGTQSRRGSRFVERMLTVTETLKRQDREVVEFLTQAIQAFRNGSKPPSLIPTTQRDASSSHVA